MFGKNYDKQISNLIEAHNKLVKSVDNCVSVVSSMQNRISILQTDLLDMEKVQAQHKTIISFLLNHVIIDADAQKDLEKMMQEIMKVEREVNNSKGGKKKNGRK